MHYGRLNGDDLDLGIEPFHTENRQFWSWRTLGLALFGYFNGRPKPMSWRSIALAVLPSNC